MSRITRGRVVTGELADAATLNGTYSDFTQPGALDEYNTRDQAFGIPHLGNAPIVLQSGTALLGNSGMLHVAPYTTLAHTTNASSPIQQPVQDSGGTNTFLDISSAPWVMASGDVLRVWWNLSVLPSFAGTPWLGGGALGRYTLDHKTTGTVVVSDGLHCWVAFLEWDITSAGLSDWVQVPGQSNFQSIINTTYKGAWLYDTAATSVISAWALFSNTADPDAGEVTSAGAGHSQGWFANYGMWSYPASGAVTVYGVRVVLTGMFHPAVSSSGANDNAIVYDIDVSGNLLYKGGRLNALLMRGS